MRNDGIDSAPAAVAEWLMHEHATRSRFIPFAERTGIAALPPALRSTTPLCRPAVARKESRVAGYKIGLTSAAMQAMCGIDSPVAGVVLGDRVHASGVHVRRSDYGRLGVEFEIAVLLDVTCLVSQCHARWMTWSCRRRRGSRNRDRRRSRLRLRHARRAVPGRRQRLERGNRARRISRFLA